MWSALFFWLMVKERGILMSSTLVFARGLKTCEKFWPYCFTFRGSSLIFRRASRTTPKRLLWTKGQKYRDESFELRFTYFPFSEHLAQLQQAVLKIIDIKSREPPSDSEESLQSPRDIKRRERIRTSSVSSADTTLSESSDRVSLCSPLSCRGAVLF